MNSYRSYFVQLVVLTALIHQSIHTADFTRDVAIHTQEGTECFVCSQDTANTNLINFNKVYGCQHPDALCKQCAQKYFRYGHSSCPLCRSDRGHRACARELGQRIGWRNCTQFALRRLDPVFNRLNRLQALIFTHPVPRHLAYALIAYGIYQQTTDTYAYFFPNQNPYEGTLVGGGARIPSNGYNRLNYDDYRI